MAISRCFSRRYGTAPRQALLHLPHLGKSLFSDSQRFYQNGNVTHFFRNGIHVLFVIHDELSHKAVPFFNPTLLKISRETKVLAIRAAGNAVIMGAGTSNHRHDEIADLYPRDFRPDFNDFAQRLMTDDQLFRARRRRAIFKGANLLVGAAYAGFQHAQLHIEGR